MSNTVTIRPSNWTIAPQGAATPQANLPGSYSMEAARSGVYGHLADSLGRLAGIEVRQRDARRADALSAAKVGFLKETMEFENGLENDMDFETHRERMKAFQDETYRKYAAMLGDDESRNALKVETTLPALRQEFEVGHRSAGRLNDRMVADFSQRTDDLLSQSGFNPQRDADALQIVRADVERLYNSGAISAMQKEKYLSDAEKTVRLNRWSVLTETDPQTVLSAFSSSLGGSVAHEVRDVVPQGYHNKIEAKVREEIVKAAQEMGVDPNLALAVAWQESGGKQGAVSGKGARGIFQLMPGTAQEMGVNPDDWRGNIRGGVGYLAKQLKAHGGDVPLALAAYNAGPGNVQKYGGVPPFEETMKYVPAVMSRAGYEAPAVAGGGGGGELVPGAGPENLHGLDTREALAFMGKAQANVRQMEAEARQQNRDAAFTAFSQMSFGTAMEALSSPKIRGQFGLDAMDAKEVEGMLHTHFNHMKDVQKWEREEYERGVVTQATDLALGAQDIPADPVAARQMVIDSNLDGYSKVRALKSIESGEVGKSDDAAYVADLQSKIITSGGLLPENEILQGVLEGRMTLETKDKMLKLREQAQGPYKDLIGSADKAIDEAFKTSLLAAGTPEQAEAKYRAKQELQMLIQEGMGKGNLMELLDPANSKYILPGLLQRHQLSMEEQRDARLNAVRGGGRGSTRAQGGNAPQRQSGQSIDDFTRKYAEEYGSGG